MNNQKIEVLTPSDIDVVEATVIYWNGVGYAAFPCLHNFKNIGRHVHLHKLDRLSDITKPVIVERGPFVSVRDRDVRRIRTVGCTRTIYEMKITVPDEEIIIVGHRADYSSFARKLLRLLNSLPLA